MIHSRGEQTTGAAAAATSVAPDAAHPWLDAAARALHFVHVIDLETRRVTSANRSVLVALGHHAPADLSIDDWASYLHPADRTGLDERQARWTTLRDGDVQEGSYRLRRIDGPYQPFLFRETVLTRRADGRPAQVIGTLVEMGPADEALEGSESFLRLSQQASRCGTWEFDTATRLLQWSDEMCRIHGVAPGATSVSLETATRFVHDDDLPAVRAEFEKLISGQRSRPVHYRIVRPDSSERLLWARAELLSDAGGPRRVVGTVVDVTDQVRAERMLQHVIEAITPVTGPDFFRSLARHLTETCRVKYACVAMLDEARPGIARSIATSRHGELLEDLEYDLGGTPCEQVALRAFRHYPTGVAQRFPHDTLLVEMGVDSYMGIPLVSGTGRTLGLIALLHDGRIPQPEQAEAILRVVAVRATAEVERVVAEKALRDSEARHTAILESSLDGLIVFTCGGEIVEFNAAAEQMLRHRRGDVIGRNVADVLMPPAMRALHGADLVRYVQERSGRPDGQRIDMPAVRADGTELRVELSLVPVRGAQPEVFAAVVRDITDRLMLEEQLRQSQKMQAIGQLAGGVAHDFNNLLTVIMGYSEALLAELPHTHALFEAASQIRDAGERAALLTRQLLLFGRKAMLEPRLLDLNSALLHTGGLLRRLLGEDVTITTSLAPRLSPTRIDRGQIEQVIVNLCLNARDAMPNGGQITIGTREVTFDEDACRTHPTWRPGRYVELRVSDTGIGLTQDVRAHLFEPFFTTKGPGRGTGLGLATVYGIVQQAGGFITVTSELDAGTTFGIFLPAADAQTAPAQPVAPQPARRGQGTILLVEDEDGVRDLARLSLERHGYTVLSASSGPDALALVDRHAGDIDALVTDVVMADMNGRELAERLRASRPDLKVLFMSGYSDDAVVRRGIGTTPAGFLQKPFDLNAIAFTVGNLLVGTGART